MSAQGLGVRIETEKDSLVDERVLLLSPGTFLDFLAGRSDNRLDFIAVDQTSNIRVGDLGSRKSERSHIRKKNSQNEMLERKNVHVIFLVKGDFLKCSEDFIEKGEGVLSPDHESTKMTSRGELK